MRSFAQLLGLTAILPSAIVQAAPYADSGFDLSPRQTCEFDSATDPSCWGEYSLSTNFYEEVPDTGVVREYWLEIGDAVLAPDGVERPVMTVNGTIPGPTLTADWGDTFVIHIHNTLETNGTSLHWHGLRQNFTNQADGVASIVQCPIAPGDTATYTFRATQYGSTWYHSHFSVQAWDGVFGGMIINGPASAPYDEDKGVILLSDWFHDTVSSLFDKAASSGPQKANNALINGLNVFDDGGSRYETSFTSGDTYRLRLVNTAIDTHFRFGIDNHTLTVIAVDLVPVEPYTTDMVSIAIAQRVDVVVTADQDAGNYWMRAIPQLTCSTNDNTLNIKGIVTYDDIEVADPTTTAPAYVDDCMDEPMASITPVVSIDAGDASTIAQFDVGLAIANGIIKWTINDNAFLATWGNPTLQKVLDPTASYDVTENIIRVNESNAWTYLVIESQLGVAHPIHLHGHDFFILAQEAAATYSDSSALNLSNPPRRDVAMLPAAGYIVMAFQNDNPGVWLVHCHIGWHTTLGLALQIIERESDIAGITDSDALDETCTNWNTYQSDQGIIQNDDGI
ncbi:multicopper oxidase [Xylariaceae sp. FL1272]|nr:multicopper oxidase [Xylariaceae sp. FL1272]